MIKTLSQETYLVFFKNDPCLQELVALLGGIPERRIGIQTYCRLVLLENKTPLVALKEVKQLFSLYNSKNKESIIGSYCEVCDCDPCDCYDYYRSSQ